jgi:hypothetical protein
MFVDSMLDALEKELRAALDTAISGLVAMARMRLEGAVAEMAKERASALAMVDARRGEFSREVEAMHTYKEAQEGRVELNIGGYRFETSVQTLRRVPHTFFDAYFSGRYAQDVCEDGSIFVDRDGEHFGHVLQYMRDGVVSVAEPGARPSVSLLRALKREFGFYCIELVADQVAEPEQPEVAYVVGGDRMGDRLSNMERYDASSGQWSAAVTIGTARSQFGACVLAGELYVSGGTSPRKLSSVEKYTPVSDTWSAVAPLPAVRSHHAAVAVGSVMYVLGGSGAESLIASVLKFDSMRGTWIDCAPMPTGNFVFAACAVGSDIYVFGGYNAAVDEQASVFKFDTEANEWRTLAPMPDASTGHSASVMYGLVYLVGVGPDCRQVLHFDPASGVWSTFASTSSIRKYGASFVVGGYLYAAGGPGGLNVPSSVECYDVASNTWTAVANMLAERCDFSAITIGSSGLAEEQDLFDSLISKALIRERR